MMIAENITYGRGLHYARRRGESVTVLTQNSMPIATVTTHTRLFVIRCACSCGWTHNVPRFRPDRHELTRTTVRDHLWGEAHHA